MTIELAAEIEQNYRDLKEERGHTWNELADEFAKNPDAGSQTVAAWCREQAETADEKPAAKPGRGKTNEQKKAEADAKAQAKADAEAAEKAAADAAAYDALSDDDKAALAALSPEEIAALTGA